MRRSHHTIIWTSLGFITLALSAAAQVARNDQDFTSGDVWITRDSPTWVADRDFANFPSIDAMFVIGDVWLTRERVSTAAQAPAPVRAGAGWDDQARMGSAQ